MKQLKRSECVILPLVIKGHTKMTPETNETMNDPIIYQVMILSGVRCIPLHPYIGKDKEIAIAIATAHIAKGTPATIIETKASELKAILDRENK